MSEPSDISRRELLRRFGSWFAAGVGVWSSKLVVESLQEELKPHAQNLIHEGVAALDDELPVPADLKHLFSSLFLGTREKVYLAPAQDNPAYAPTAADIAANPFDVFTRTTLDAARSFGSVLTNVEERMKRTRDIVLLNGEGNIIAFGSPTSNLIARAALGYELIAGRKSELRHIESGAMRLPIVYELDGDAIRRSGTRHREITRVVRGVESTIPNWGIRRRGAPPECPKVVGDALGEDYLLISSLPNAFSRASLDNGHRIVNLGGTHREGTAAIASLFHSREILQELAARISLVKGSRTSQPFWQAVVLVDCNQHGSERLVCVHDFAEVEVDLPALQRIADVNSAYIRGHHTR